MIFKPDLNILAIIESSWPLTKREGHVPPPLEVAAGAGRNPGSFVFGQWIMTVPHERKRLSSSRPSGVRVLSGRVKAAPFFLTGSEVAANRQG